MKVDGFDGGLELSDRSDLNDTDVVAQVIHAPGKMAGFGFQTSSFATAFEACYAALAGFSVGSFEPLRIIQDLAGESTTLWMRLEPSGPELRPGTADDLRLTFLARGTLTILGWLATPAPEMPDLCRAIHVLANGTLPPKSRVPTQHDLVTAVAALQDLKAALPDVETVKVILHRGAADFDIQAPPLDLDALLRKTLLKSAEGEMILIVEEPDYARSGKWSLRHGTQRVEARCDSGPIVDAFYRRSLDIRPGDALRCRVRIDRSYDFDNELLSEKLNIVEIVGILSEEVGELPVKFEAQEPPARDPEPRDQPDRTVTGHVVSDDENILEQLEGEFGVLTLREIPIN
jgi:hypothetical protein